MARSRTDKTHTPERASGAADAAEGAATRRIAWGTMFRAVGEAVAKIASVLFYVVLARELGEAVFGDFIFGLSLAGVVLTMAAFGTDDLIAREVAQGPREGPPPLRRHPGAEGPPRGRRDARDLARSCSSATTRPRPRPPSC